MAICSYLVIAEPGSTVALRRRLSGIPCCDVVAAENRDVLLLVTDAPDPGADEALRERVSALEGVKALVLTFGEIDTPAR